MKRKLLFAAMMIAGAFGLNAQVYFETDLTTQFSSLTDWKKWTGATGYTATNFCPMVTTNAGQNVQVCERFTNGKTTAVGDAFYQEVSGLTAGTYKIELYGASSSTQERDGFTPTDAITEGDMTSVYLYATTSNGTVKKYIPVHIATSFAAAETAVLEGVEIGTDGVVRLGMYLEKSNTNWHVVQLKGVTATVNAIDVYNTALDAAKAIQTEKMNTAALTGLQNAITTYGAVESSNAEDYRTAIDALEAATAFANKSINSYKVIAAGVIPDNSLDGWTCTNSNDFHINTWSVEGNPGNDPSGMVTPFIENWVGKGSFLGAGTVSYTLEGLEPGEVYYAQALVRSYNEANADAPNGPDFFINDAVTSLADAGTTFTYNGMSGIYATLGGAATVGADGKLTLGVEIAEERNYNWVAFKNVTIRPMADALQASVEKAEALYDQLPNSAKQDLEAVVEVNDKSWSTAAEYEDAIAEIEAAVTTAQPFVAPFAAFKEVKATADELFAEHTKLKAFVTGEGDNVDNATTIDEITDATAAVKEVVDIYKEWVAVKANADVLVAAANDNEAANTVLQNAIKDAADAVANTDNVTLITTTVDGLINAMNNYAKSANPVGDAKFDLTFMLTNPDLTGLKTWAPADGWAGENAGNSQVMQSDDVKASDGKNYFYEFWSNNPYDNGKFNLYLTVELPAGTYQMECLAFAQCAANSSTSGQTPVANGISFSANDTDGSYITSLTLDDASLTFVNKETQDVKIGLKAQAGNNRTWMGIGYVKMYKIPAEAAVELKEDVAYVEEAKAADVKLTRTIYEGFNTVVLPFSMTADEIATVFGAGTLYQFDDADAGVLNFSEATALAPHIPFLFKADAAKSISEETIAGRTITISTNNLTKAGADYNFVGTYAPLAAGNDVITAADFVLGADKFVIAKGGNALKAFRAFIQANEEVPEVKALTINIDGVATAIEAIDGKVIANGMLYNLAGQRVSKAQKGIFIQNGKKVIK